MSIHIFSLAHLCFNKIKLVNILKTTFWNTLCWMKRFICWYKCHWFFFTEDPIYNKLGLVQVIAWCQICTNLLPKLVRTVYWCILVYRSPGLRTNDEKFLRCLVSLPSHHELRKCLGRYHWWYLHHLDHVKDKFMISFHLLQRVSQRLVPVPRLRWHLRKAN